MKIAIGTRISHPQYGVGVVCAVRFSNYKVVFTDKGVVDIAKTESLEVIEYADEEGKVAVEDIQEILAEFLDNLGVSKPIALGDKWKKGSLILKPYDSSLSNKEIPIEDFFHKIVMLRDRLRVLEQKVNASSKLDESEKIDMQQYITRCYGSLTTFNVLFKYKEDNFVGQKGE